jgi:hypothetical protein
MFFEFKQQHFLFEREKKNCLTKHLFHLAFNVLKCENECNCIIDKKPYLFLPRAEQRMKNRNKRKIVLIKRN